MTKKRSTKAAKAADASPDPIDELALCLEAVAEMRDGGKYDRNLVSHLSWLKLNAAREENERAKIAERAEKRLRALSWSQVVAWARRLTDSEWSRLVREVETARGGRGSVLG